VIPGRFVLFIGGIMLLVHDHDPQAGQWREDRRSDPDHDVGFPLSNAKPLVESLAWSQGAMEQCDALPEAFPESLRHPRGEGNLGHQDQGLLPPIHDPLDGLKVDLGLAAAGHTEKEEGDVALCGDRFFDLVKGFALRRGEGEGIGAGDWKVLEGVMGNGALQGFDESSVHEGIDGRGGPRNGPDLTSR
jgi:hypothetical protein